METTFDCSVCGQAKPVPTDSCTTGYGYDAENRKVCFACCAIRDKAQMDADGKTVLYLGENEVTNWPGTLRYRVWRMVIGRHNMAGKRFDVWFHDHLGKSWHGVQYGEMTQLCHCRRLK